MSLFTERLAASLQEAERKIQTGKTAGMKRICLIRHGESVSNAGAPTDDHENIPLSPRGEKQAEERSRQFTLPAELILVSPYLRARQTMLPTARRFPQIPVEVWDSVREFTYLSPASCRGTTKEERRPRVQAYWAASDPDYHDGEGAESYREFVGRTMVTLQRLRERPEAEIWIFAHAQSINNLLLCHLLPELPIQEKMHEFTEIPLPANASLSKFYLWE